MDGLDVIWNECWACSGGAVNNHYVWKPYLTALEQAGALRHRFVFVQCINYFHITQIRDMMPWGLWKRALDELGDRQMVVVLDSHKEGPSWRHVETTVTRMIADGVDPRCILLWTGGSHEPASPISTITTMDAFCLLSPPPHEFRPMGSPTHHFVMLARVPRLHRILAAVGILRRGLDRFGTITCGSGDYGPAKTWLMDMHVPQDLRHRFPIMLPGSTQVSTYFSEEENLESVRNPMVTGAFASVVPESSHDLMAPLPCTAFMTEKSEKAFMLGQVPLWIGATGSAAHARSWGFDLFDDIVDHSYDDEPDPHLRIGMVLDQLEIICGKPMEHWRRYREDNRDRFIANQRRCAELRSNRDLLQFGRLEEFMRGLPQAG